MPTYEYSCQNPNCQHNWEQEQKMADPKIKVCPACQEETAQRLISRSNFVLVGGGWGREGYK